jgi:hypothetical protein
MFSVWLIFYVYREVVMDLIEEYKAAEKPDYVTWGGSVSSTSYVPAGEDLASDSRMKRSEGI